MFKRRNGIQNLILGKKIFEIPKRKNIELPLFPEKSVTFKGVIYKVT